jgi:hypothetical protein
MVACLWSEESADFRVDWAVRPFSHAVRVFGRLLGRPGWLRLTAVEVRSHGYAGVAGLFVALASVLDRPCRFLNWKLGEHFCIRSRDVCT